MLESEKPHSPRGLSRGPKNSASKKPQVYKCHVRLWATTKRQPCFYLVKCRHTRILRERPILHRRKVSRQAEAGISTKMTSHCRHLVAHTFSCSPESMLKCSGLRLPGTAYVQAASCGTASRGNVSRGSSRNVLKMSSWNTCHKKCVGRRSFATNLAHIGAEAR